MNVLSLFDGMSCGMIALDRAGISVDKYYASEIDDLAIKISEDNYPDILRLGDVTKWRTWEIDWANIDLLIGGSPCQGFSFAGNQLAFDDPRSALFFVYVEILNHIKLVNPNVKFMLENVRMKIEYMNVISEQLGVTPVRINSRLVSAQMRDRYYWANWEIGQPSDKKVLLKDIITNGFVEKDKSWCVLESWNRFPKKTESAKGRYKRAMMPIVFESESCSFNDGWRELDVGEVERLQTVPTGYCNAIEGKKAKGVLGNGWTIDVIAFILSGLTKGEH